MCAEGFTIQHRLPFEMYIFEIYEMFVYEHTETIEYV